MRRLDLNNITLTVDFSAGHITSLAVGGKERAVGTLPLFRVRVRDAAGDGHVFSAYDAEECTECELGAVY